MKRSFCAILFPILVGSASCAVSDNIVGSLGADAPVAEGPRQDASGAQAQPDSPSAAADAAGVSKDAAQGHLADVGTGTGGNTGGAGGTIGAGGGGGAGIGGNTGRLGGTISAGGVGGAGIGGNTGGLGGTGGCPVTACPALACVGGYLPNPEPCGCPICAPNSDAGVARDSGGPDSPPVCPLVACPMLACVGGYLPNPEPCGCPICSGGSPTPICSDATECTGALPALCQQCADGSSACAHFTCVAGHCQVAYCP